MARQRTFPYSSIVVLSVFSLTLLTIPATAQGPAPAGGQARPGEAGLVAVPASGQTRCYNTAGTEIACAGTGQDGEFRAGTAWDAATRFVAGSGAESDCLVDTLTGLMWPKNADLAGGFMLWADAFVEVTEHAPCGHTDWRVPNINELASLMHRGSVEAACGGAFCADMVDWLTTAGFTNVQRGPYWSSTTSAISQWYAKEASLYTTSEGTIGVRHKGGEQARLWPVRDSGTAGAVQVPATGQQTCWDTGGDEIDCEDTGQDGEFRRGYAWTPATRFETVVVGSDTCILDTLTGLMWTANADLKGTTRLWANALSDANALTYCGYSDWRLPNEVELGSLAHWGFNEETCGTAACDSLGEWLESVGFDNAVLPSARAFRWTSTSFATDPTLARSVTLHGGDRLTHPKANGYNSVWPVRGGLPDTRTLTVTKTGSGSGTVTPDSGSLAWVGDVGSGSYPSGTLVGLTAEAAGDSTFDGWGGDCSGVNTTTSVLLDVDRACTATFLQVTHTVTPVVVPPAAGTMTCDPNPVPHGLNSSCVIAPAPGYGLQNVTGCGAGILIGLTYTTAAMTADCTVTATLQTRPDFVVTAVTTVPPVPVPGKPVTVKATVRNQGLAAGTLGTVNAWLDRPGVPGCGEAADAARSFGPLAAGAQKQVVFRGLVAGLEGAKTAQVMADAGCVTTEADEGNNTRALAYDVVLPKPDFVVTGITFVPVSPLTGALFKAKVTIRNQGDAAGEVGSLTLWLDRLGPPGCGEIGDKTVTVGRIGKGGRKVVTVPGLAAGAAGAKNLLAFADSACARPETDETNNQFTQGYVVR